MKIGIIGLGIMGASFAKALRKNTSAQIFGRDTNNNVLKMALEQHIIDGELTSDTATDVDILLVALFPRLFADAVKELLPQLKKGAVITDFCGNKRIVLAQMEIFAKQFPHLQFVGGHPMAGAEVCGIENSRDNLFDGASMILVPCSQCQNAVGSLKELYLSVGFDNVVVCDANHHDAVVAYTSQLCHLVSNAFIKNKSASLHAGYSAGSYLDLTRVAKMNSAMWAELMTDNRDKLSAELAELIANLQKYQCALERGDEQELHDLLEEGNQRKLQIDSEL